MKKAIYLTLATLLVFSMLGCSSTKQEDSSSQEETSVQEPSAEEFAQAETTLNHFIEVFNDTSISQVSPVDINNIKSSIINNHMQAFFDETENLAQGLYAYPSSSGNSDCVAVAITENEIRVRGMSDKNPMAQNTFKSAFLAMSKDATDAMFEQLVEDEVFYYGGKSGEIAGVAYEVTVYGSYHVVNLSAPLSINSF